MSALNGVAHQKPRSTLIMTLQRESKQLRHLENENRELKCALEDHHFALELIMSKYRQQITQLIKVEKAEKEFLNMDKNGSKELLQKHADKICEMAAVMNKAAEIDEINMQKERELLFQLKAENEGLREMLRLAKVSGSLKEVEKQTIEVQTES